MRTKIGKTIAVLILVATLAACGKAASMEDSIPDMVADIPPLQLSDVESVEIGTTYLVGHSGD